MLSDNYILREFRGDALPGQSLLVYALELGLVHELDSTEIAELSRRRWTIEGTFGELDAVLECEVRRLSKPRAALVAFGVAVLAYNEIHPQTGRVNDTQDSVGQGQRALGVQVLREEGFREGVLLLVHQREACA